MEITPDDFVKMNEEFEREGNSHEILWRENQGARFTMCREKYGPEWKGNEENYKALIEWRFYVYREPFWEGSKSYVVTNDSFEGARQLEALLGLAAPAPGALQPHPSAPPAISPHSPVGAMPPALQLMYR